MVEQSIQSITVVGLGMVSIAFLEKIFSSKFQGEVQVFGEEAHFAYNRVGLTNYFSHKSIDQLFIQDKHWYDNQEGLKYHLSSKVIQIDPKLKLVFTEDGNSFPFNTLILATGSSSVFPSSIQGMHANGIFGYRTIADLENMIQFSTKVAKPRRALVIGGGLLGLEAAHAVQSLDRFESVEIVQRSGWLLSRQLDQQAGLMVNKKVTDLGIDLRLNSSISRILVDDHDFVSGVEFVDGSFIECDLICFAIGIAPRDELARTAGIACAERGGIMVNKNLETSIPGIYAIGECASFEENTFGLIAPGIEMASVLSRNLVETVPENITTFKTPDLSTKLKLLGVEVASFGDYFADILGPKSIPGSTEIRKFTVDDVNALVYKDPFTSLYKKLIFSADGKYLLGGMMIGDTTDYVKLLSMVKSGKPLSIPPSELILGKSNNGGGEGLGDLPDDAQICSCMNVTKGDVVKLVKEEKCSTLAQIKACTKAGSQCGGCAPLVQSIFESARKAMGASVSKAICLHFDKSRVELLHIVTVKQFKTFEQINYEVGRFPDSIGCSICKPAIAGILASLWNEHVMDKSVLELQDTNDKYLGNIQRNGTYSVVPRIAGGEITPDKLIVLGEVAKKYKLYTKITGGQRIDMFGARKHELPEIWEVLVKAGFESGHAYGKALRTVKSCVGSSWCRFGQGDSVGLAIGLEERYKSIRSPHKIKGGVSGCIRECAEAQSKDFGLIATEKGYNIYVCGNGGSKPKHDCPVEDVVPILDRFMMFYIRTADKLQRTARWIENLDGGLEYLKSVILEDSLGINEVLENQMQALVGSYFDEWQQVVANPTKKRLFKQFANTDANVEAIEIIQERGQFIPADWPKSDLRTSFHDQVWTKLEFIPLLRKSLLFSESCAVLYGDTQLAIFHVKGRYYCMQAMCPHKRAFVLHDGLIGDDADGNIHVACPLHKRQFGLNSGVCLSDSEFTVATFEIEERNGMLWAKLPALEEIDAELGTSVWKIKAGEVKRELDGIDIVGRKAKSNVCHDGQLEW